MNSPYTIMSRRSNEPERITKGKTIKVLKLTTMGTETVETLTVGEIGGT